MKMNVTQLGIPVAAVLVLTACTATRKRQVLTFFFDGVPPPNTGSASPEPVVAATAEVAPALPDLYVAARAAPPGVRHKPYVERKCTACHESQFSQKLRAEVAEVCQLCHKGVFEARPFKHAPVEAGYCLGCHSPHESLERGLLNLPARQVCAECHEETQVVRIPAHAKIGQEACHTCHDPHGGQNRLYLRDTALHRNALLPLTGPSP